MTRLVAGLLEDTPGVTVYRIDKTFEGDLDKATRQAREYLSSTDAQVLVWGRVQKKDGESAPQLRWVTRFVDVSPIGGGPYLIRDFELPTTLLRDLRVIVRQLVEHELVLLSHYDRGPERTKALTSFKNRLRTLLNEQANQSETTVNELMLSRVYADSLVVAHDSVADLRHAIEGYRLILKLLPTPLPEGVTGEAAVVRHNFAVALRDLEWHSPSASIFEAIDQFRQAKSAFEQTPDRTRQLEATLNLGEALAYAGSRDGSVELIREAIELLRKAMSTLDRNMAPRQWASAAVLLAGAGAELNASGGVADFSPRDLLRDAMGSIDRTGAMQLWVRASLTLADVLLNRSNPTVRDIQDALDLSTDVLRSTDATQSPETWQEAAFRRGVALEFNAQTPTLRDEAIEQLRAVVRVTNGTGTEAEFSAMVELANTLVTSAQLDHNAQRSEDAIAMLRDATRRVPSTLKAVRSNLFLGLGTALVVADEQLQTKVNDQEAVTAFETALDAAGLPVSKRAVVQTEFARGLLYYRADALALDKAAGLLRSALLARTWTSMPNEWAISSYLLVVTLTSLGSQRKDLSLLCESITVASDLTRRLSGSAVTNPRFEMVAAAAMSASMQLIHLDQSAWDRCTSRIPKAR